MTPLALQALKAALIALIIVIASSFAQSWAVKYGRDWLQFIFEIVFGLSIAIFFLGTIATVLYWGWR